MKYFFCMFCVLCFYFLFSRIQIHLSYTNIIHIYLCILELALLLLHFTLLHCLWHAILSYLWLVLLAYNKWNLSGFIPAGLRDSGWCGVPQRLSSRENISCPHFTVFQFAHIKWERLFTSSFKRTTTTKKSLL